VASGDGGVYKLFQDFYFLAALADAGFAGAGRSTI
jgi:hypothetical protein